MYENKSDIICAESYPIVLKIRWRCVEDSDLIEDYIWLEYQERAMAFMETIGAE